MKEGIYLEIKEREKLLEQLCPELNGASLDVIGVFCRCSLTAFADFAQSGHVIYKPCTSYTTHTYTRSMQVEVK